MLPKTFEVPGDGVRDHTFRLLERPPVRDATWETRNDRSESSFQFRTKEDVIGEFRWHIRNNTTTCLDALTSARSHGTVAPLWRGAAAEGAILHNSTWCAGRPWGVPQYHPPVMSEISHSVNQEIRKA